MKISITGSNGQLGTELVELFGYKNDLQLLSLPKHDITDDSIVQTIRSFDPDVTINCAAFTDVDACEYDNRAVDVNFLGAVNVAYACLKSHSDLVHISTDYVFDGERDGYREDDKPNPINRYGQTKLWAENAIKGMLFHKAYIVRTSRLYGKNGDNFVTKFLHGIENKSSVNMVRDQFGQPTYSKDLAEAIEKLIQTEKHGTYHLTNSGYCSWYGWAKEILKLSGKDCFVNPISTQEWKRLTPIPKNSVLLNRNAFLQGITIRPWQEALASFMSTIT